MDLVLPTCQRKYLRVRHQVSRQAVWFIYSRSSSSSSSSSLQPPKADNESICLQVSKEEAEKRIKAIKEPYKLEILESIVARNPNDPITIYHLGQPEGEGEHWWDLCAGPHVQTTKDLNPAAVDLETIAGVSDASAFCTVFP